MKLKPITEEQLFNLPRVALVDIAINRLKELEKYGLYLAKYVDNSKKSTKKKK